MVVTVLLLNNLNAETRLNQADSCVLTPTKGSVSQISGTGNQLRLNQMTYSSTEG